MGNDASHGTEGALGREDGTTLLNADRARTLFRREQVTDPGPPAPRGGEPGATGPAGVVQAASLRAGRLPTCEGDPHFPEGGRDAGGGVREDALAESGGWLRRIGSVPYLNAAPLVRGLEGHIRLLPPSHLARELRAGRLDAALVSITEALHHDAYELLEGMGVASFGEVYSVFLAHRGRLEDVTRVRCDTASLTSVNLLRVLLAGRGLHPRFEPLGSVATAGEEEAVLLIGDEAISFRRAGHPHAIWDLGEAWREWTGLPFVYAAWSLRRGADTGRIRAALVAAAARGQRELEAVIRESAGFDEAFRRVYLTRHTHHVLTGADRAGVARFVELLRRHGDRQVYEPRWVSG